MRELYTKCALENITGTTAFKDCLQFINFQSKVKLEETIKDALKVVNFYLKLKSPTKPLQPTPKKNNMNNFVFDNLGENFVRVVRVHLLMFLKQIENASTDSDIASVEDEIVENLSGNRYKLKEVTL